MPTELESEQKLIWATKTPDIKALIMEYEKASPVYDRFHRIINNDDIRLNRWTNKSEDGKKYSSEDEQAFPFEGASDSENFLTDDTINELVAILVVSFWRSVVQRVHGTELSDYEQAANFNKLLDWLMHSKLFRELAREVELSAQYLLTYGYVILMVIWDRRMSKHYAEIKMETVVQVSQQIEGLASLAGAIMDPDREDEAIQLLDEQLLNLMAAYFKRMFGRNSDELLANYSIKPKTIRKLIRALRNEGIGELPIPFFAKNEPSVTAMKIGEDVFLQSYVANIQETTVFVREFMTEQILRSRGAIEGWNSTWIEEAAKRKGKQSTWSVDTADERLDVDSWEFTWLEGATSGHDLIEVLTAYTWRLDDENVAERYYTIFHADIPADDTGKPLYAKHGLVDYDHKRMPFVIGLREWRSRNFNASRGVPNVLRSRQRQLKTFYDGLVDFQSIAVFPPLHVYDNGLGTDYVYGPAVKNPVSPGREPKALDIPTRGAPVAFELVKIVNSDVANAFGLMDPDVPPTRVQIKQQMLVNSFLTMWTEALQQEFSLVRQYMSDEEFKRITGSEIPLSKGPDLTEDRDFTLQLDVRTLDMEHVLKEFKAIAEAVRPLDANGVIDFGRLVRAMVRAINPSLAKEIILDKESASQAIFRKTQNDLLLMLGGFEPEYGQDDDPAAGMKLQYLQQLVMTNPKLQNALGNPQMNIPPGDPDFAERVDKYVENLQFNLSQQENKKRGRIGI